MENKNKYLHLINVGAVLTAAAAVGVMALVLPKPTVSEIEKRELAKKPAWTLSSWFSGEFAEEYDAYYADTFPGREGLVSMASKIEQIKGVHPDDVRIHQGTNTQTATDNTANEPTQDKTDKDSAQQTEETQKQPIDYRDPNAPGNGLAGEGSGGEQVGSLFMYKNMGMQIFGANETMSRRYAEVISSYAAALPDVQVYNLIAPTSIEFYLPEKYKSMTSSQKENIKFISDELSGVKAVDAYSEIEKQKDDYIYFRTDHHWTVRGAYAAYLAFCQEAGFEPVPLDKMERTQIDGFVGTFYNQTQDEKLSETPDFVEYFMPPTETQTQRYTRGNPFDPVDGTIFASYATGGQNTYSVFLHGDFPLTHIKTDNHTGRKVMLVKESFGNAFAPFLISHYDEVFIVDQRYFELNLTDFIKENGVTDLLFLNNIFAANTGVRINELERIKDQTYVPYVPPVQTPAVPTEETPQETVSEPTDEPLPAQDKEDGPQEKEESKKPEVKKKKVIKKKKSDG